MCTNRLVLGTGLNKARLLGRMLRIDSPRHQNDGGSTPLFLQVYQSSQVSIQ